MRQYSLLESGNAVASGGVATVRLGPRRAFERWLIESVAVQSTSTTEPELREYLGEPSPSRMTGNSRAGTLDSGFNASPIVLESGEDIVYQWTGCSASATCIVTIKGTRQLP